MPNAKPAIAPRARPARRSFARAGRLTIAAGPGAGTTTSPAWWKRRLSTPPGWNACRTAFRTARPRRPYERSAIWTSPNFRRSFRRAASAGIDHPSLTLTHVMHRDLPRPSLRATPKALRYGRGSLLCMTWISFRPPPMRGHDWTRKGGRNWKRFDILDGRSKTVGAAMAIERGHLLSCPTEGLDLAEIVFALVDKQGCVTVKTNLYSVPVRAGTRVEVRVHPLHVEIRHAGRLVARHERCHSRRQHVLDLEHYLDVLSHKPGAFAGSKPLAQWRAAGRWPACYDELWDRLRARHGKQNGTRAMVAVLALGREFGQDRLHTAVASAVSHGACDVAAVRYLLTEAALHKARPVAVDVGALARYDRPLPNLADYDTLLV